MLKWRFKDRIQTQMDAFLNVRHFNDEQVTIIIVQGFSQIIPLGVIKVFDEKELEVSVNNLG